ncbi:MAG: hypothetical protein ACXWDH_02385, partial [Aeromicrobium sp.]
MPDSRPTQRVERRRANPLQVAADSLSEAEKQDAHGPTPEVRSHKATNAAPRSPRSATDNPISHAERAFSNEAERSGSDEEHDQEDDSPRGRRAAARNARQAAAERRRVEKAAAKAFAASKRHNVRNPDARVEETTLSQKMSGSRADVAQPPASSGVPEPELPGAVDAGEATEPAEEPVAEAGTPPEKAEPAESTAAESDEPPADEAPASSGRGLDGKEPPRFRPALASELAAEADAVEANASEPSAAEEVAMEEAADAKAAAGEAAREADEERAVADEASEERAEAEQAEAQR